MAGPTLPFQRAINFTDRYVDAGVKKIDAAFGPGFAKANPGLLAAYLATCSANLSALATARAGEPAPVDDANDSATSDM